MVALREHHTLAIVLRTALCYTPFQTLAMPQGQDNKPPNQRAAASPVLIPLHNDYASPGSGGDDSFLPEWAMIELNGELIAPTTTTIPNSKDKENPCANDNEPDSSLLGHDQVELGSVRFVNNVSVYRQKNGSQKSEMCRFIIFHAVTNVRLTHQSPFASCLETRHDSRYA